MQAPGACIPFNDHTTGPILLCSFLGLIGGHATFSFDPFLKMADIIVITRPTTGDVVHIPVTSIIKLLHISEAFLCSRFGLAPLGVASIVNSLPPYDEIQPQTTDSSREWILRAGFSYNLRALVDPQPVLTGARQDKGKTPVEVVNLSDDDDDDSDGDDTIITNDRPPTTAHSIPKVEIITSDGDSDPVAQTIAPATIGDSVSQQHRISALSALLAIRGHSELAKFVQQNKFVTRQVRCLPRSYNGDIIFELPPVQGDPRKGDRVVSMERAKDCYYWTRTTPTSAIVLSKDFWEFGKHRCTGSLECRNDNCPYFSREGSRNCAAWAGNYKVQIQHSFGQRVEEGGITCGHCEQRPFCVAACPALMFYMYPGPSVPKEKRDHVSRCCIHMSEHNHPPRIVFSRESLERVTELLDTQVRANPSATPCLLRNNTIRDLMAQVDPESAIGLGEDQQTELWESLKVISNPSAFTSVLRSVRKDKTTGNGMFDVLARMQKNCLFPYIQRYRAPGQGSIDDFPMIFKMSVKGPGSGVDILRRMLPGGNLHGTWVMFDVMRRLSDGWLTFSSHVYDHHYRSLCTIFTCELKSEGAKSIATAWRQMIDVAKENGVPRVEIYGFMADNAIGGWNAVREVFFGGVSAPDRERSDAFHWSQSLHRHTRGCIVDGKHGEHIAMWERLRRAPNVVEAYRVSHEIREWWRQGNHIPGKIRFLEGWLAWWTVRWTQWGNFLRVVSFANLSVGLIASARR